jgi:tetratricopeptide (TPR) repeat protein
LLLDAGTLNKNEFDSLKNKIINGEDLDIENYKQKQNSSNPNKKNSMGIKNCQACGASNRNDKANCDFCGTALQQDNNLFQGTIDKLNADGNKFKLAEVAFEGGDYDEAIAYYNKCLEIDSDFFECWYKKALSILKTSTVGNFKSQQATASFNQAIRNSPNANDFKKRLKIDVLPFVSDYYYVAFNHFKSFSNTSNSGVEFAEKLMKANETVQFIIDSVGLTIQEVKQLHAVLKDIGAKLSSIMMGKIFLEKGGVDKVNNDLKFAGDKISHIRDNVLLPLWEELEPSTAPKKGGCFVATAAMGDYDHPVVLDLRNFRDHWLLKRRWGARFTDWYYTHGPKAANLIEKSSLLKILAFYLVVKPLQLITKWLK